jgi:oligoribonuclease NrnB/cAMP/cGMP phosphodiesterase (DHH superfamily)
MSLKIFYHRADYDGIASGAILKRKFPYSTLIAADYSDPIQPYLNMIEDGDEVIFADYVFNPLESISNLVKTKHVKVTVIDHHITSINYFKEHPNDIYQLIDPKEEWQSAAYLCWKYCYPRTLVPEAIKMISYYDTWKHDYKDQYLHFMAGLFTVDLKINDKKWDKLLNLTCYDGVNYRIDQVKYNDASLIQEITTIGTYVQAAEDSFSKKAVDEGAFELELQGRKLIAMNTNKKGALQFKSAKEYDGYLVFCALNNGQWRYSIYCDPSKQDVIRCDLIAESFGGGGHKGAAGFQTEELIPEILTTLKNIRNH